MLCEKCNSSVNSGEFCEECGHFNQESRDKDNVHSEEFIESSINNLIKVEYDKTKVLVANQFTEFPYRITTLASNISNIMVGFSMSGEFQDNDFFPTSWESSQDESRIFKNINLKPDTPGIIGAIFYISFTYNDENFSYESDVSLKIYPNPSEVKKDIAINITAGHAADINIKDLNFSDSAKNLDNLIDENYTRESEWTEFNLFKSNRLIENNKSTEDSTIDLPKDKLIQLEIDKNSYTFIFKEELILGKHRECDFVTRLYKDGRATSEINQKLSRYHCVLRRKDRNCYYIFDGANDQEGLYRPSTYGTYIDNTRVDSHNGFKLTKDHKIMLGGINPQLSGVYCCDISINHFVSIQSKQRLLNTNVAIKKDSDRYIMAENVVSLNSISASLPHFELFFENGKPILGGNKKIILISGEVYNLSGCSIRVVNISKD